MATNKRSKKLTVGKSHRPARAKKITQVRVAHHQVPKKLLLQRRGLSRLKLVYLFLFLVAVGQIVIGASWYLLYRQTVLSFQVAPSVIADLHLRGEIPLQVILPSVRIDLPIVATEIKDGVWQIPDRSAGFLAASARPQEGGNIVIYAHNLRALFGPLAAVKVGDEVVLKAAKDEFHYTVKEKKIVNPNQIDVVLPTDYEVLTLYTCIGLLDSQRLVVKAVPNL